MRISDWSSDVCSSDLLLGTDDVDATGNNADNELVGNQGNNHLEGLAGNDLLNGGPGNDTLLGGIGNDELDGGHGVDTLVGGTGEDKHVVNAASDGVVEVVNEGRVVVNDRGDYSLSEKRSEACSGGKARGKSE